MNLKGSIVFSSGRSGDFDIWRLDLDSQKLTQLTQGVNWNDMPRWSPDGKHIVFTSNRGGGVSSIFLMSEWGEDLRQITHDQRYHSCPAWHPDGQRIVCTANEQGSGEEIDIWEFPVYGDGAPQRLFSGPGIESEPSYSPDGKKLVFSSAQGGSFDVWELELETGNLRQITDGPSKDFCPAYSPDGSMIAYLSKDDPRSDSEICIVPSDLSAAPLKISDNRVNENDIAWSPDSRYLIYSSNSTGKGDGRIRVLDVAAGKTHRLNYKRKDLEAEIGAFVQDYGVFSLLTPDAVQRLFIDKSYWGSERHPDWKF